GCVAGTVGLLLTQLVLVETPDAALLLELRTRILSGEFRPPVLRLAGIGRRANVNEYGSFTVERDPLVVMWTAERKIRDDHFAWARRLQLARCELEALDGRCRPDIQVPVAQRDSGCALVAESLFHVR